MQRLPVTALTHLPRATLHPFSPWLQEEMFEMNWVEYVRRDTEGSDSDTRRRAASELVKSLTERFPAEVRSHYAALRCAAKSAEPADCGVSGCGCRPLAERWKCAGQLLAAVLMHRGTCRPLFMHPIIVPHKRSPPPTTHLPCLRR